MGTVTHDNATEFYTTGETAFARIGDDIVRASDKDVTFYLLGWSCRRSVPMRADKPSTLDQILTNFAGSGGRIRAMLWDNRYPDFDPGTRDMVSFLNGLPLGAAILDRRTPLAGAHHQKMQALVDANGTPTAAYCGGMDLFEDRLVGQPAPAPLHDVHARVVGAAAVDLVAPFVERWNDHPARKGDLTRPPNSLAALDGYDLVQVGRTYPRFEPYYAKKVAIFDQNLRQHLPDLPIGDMTDGENIRLYGFYDNAKGVQQIWRMIRHAVRTAQQFIYLEDQYLISESVGKLLASKLSSAKPNFRLVILVGKEPDFPQVWARRRQALAALEKVDPGHRRWRIFYRRLDRPSFYVHSKTWIFDDELVITGSANCDRRGMTYNSELNFGVVGQLKGNRISEFGASTVAQELRCRLWAKHLGGAPHDYLSASATIARWFGPVLVGNVRLFKPDEIEGAEDKFLAKIPPLARPALWAAGGTLSSEDAIHDLIEDPDRDVPLSL